MEEGTENFSKQDKENYSKQDREDIFSKSMKAGRRTYFFDVKSTKGNDYYLTITESQKRFSDDGSSKYEKHKIFIYKEDFEKFGENLADCIAFITRSSPEAIVPRVERNYEKPLPDSSNTSSDNNTNKHSSPNSDSSSSGKNFTDINFEDLDK